MSATIQLVITGVDTVTSVLTIGILNTITLTAPTQAALTLTSIGTQGDAGPVLPSGGTTDQHLIKLSDITGDYNWTSTLDGGVY
jgi:hypothetical protein